MRSLLFFNNSFYSFKVPCIFSSMYGPYSSIATSFSSHSYPPTHLTPTPLAVVQIHKSVVTRWAWTTYQWPQPQKSDFPSLSSHSFTVGRRASPIHQQPFTVGLGASPIHQQPVTVGHGAFPRHAEILTSLVVCTSPWWAVCSWRSLESWFLIHLSHEPYGTSQSHVALAVMGFDTIHIFFLVSLRRALSL